jgi:hypothetical protein
MVQQPAHGKRFCKISIVKMSIISIYKMYERIITFLRGTRCTEIVVFTKPDPEGDILSRVA